MHGSRSGFLPTLAFFFFACVDSQECDMSVCARNDYALSLQHRTRQGDNFLPVDTLKAGEAGLFLNMTQASGRNGAQGDCRSCDFLLTGEKLYSERDIIADGDTLRANTNLLDAEVAVKWATGGPGTRIFKPEVRLKKGANTFRYEANLELEGKNLLTIRDTVDFWVVESVGY